MGPAVAGMRSPRPSTVLTPDRGTVRGSRVRQLVAPAGEERGGDHGDRRVRARGVCVTLMCDKNELHGECEGTA